MFLVCQSSSKKHEAIFRYTRNAATTLVKRNGLMNVLLFTEAVVPLFN